MSRIFGAVRQNGRFVYYTTEARIFSPDIENSRSSPAMLADAGTRAVSKRQLRTLTPRELRKYLHSSIVY
jgi:hypothetical protein